jgi:carboxylesterase
MMNTLMKTGITQTYEELGGGEHAVLLIHGLSGSPFEVMYLAKKLNKAGFTVRVPLLPGHGESVGTLSSKKWQGWSAEVSAHFEDLSGKYKSVSVAGLCMGAVLALYLAAEKGERVKSLSAMATTLFFDGWALPWYKFLMPLATHTPLRHFMYFGEREPYGIKNERLRERVASAMKDDSSGIAYSKMPMTSIREMQKLIAATKARLHEIKAPTLILHAEEDDVASMKNADYLECHMGAANIKRINLHDSYHLITIDNERDTVASETAAFFVQQSFLAATAAERNQAPQRGMPETGKWLQWQPVPACGDIHSVEGA